MRKKNRLTTQKAVIAYLRKLKPKYRIRVPLRDKRGPFLIQLDTDVPGNTTQIRESVYYKLKKRNKLKHSRRVWNTQYAFDEYRFNTNGRKK